MNVKSTVAGHKVGGSKDTPLNREKNFARMNPPISLIFQKALRILEKYPRIRQNLPRCA